MIEKNEILKMAAGLDLNPDTVERDYVLGWMLFGINRQPEISLVSPNSCKNNSIKKSE